MKTSPAHHRRTFTRAMAALAAALCVVRPAVSRAQVGPDPVLAREQIIITAAGMTVQPAHQVVPRNTATIITTRVEGPGQPGLAPALPSDALVTAELRGPSFSSPVAFSARPGESITIPPLAISGLYVLDNIRVVSADETLLVSDPPAVTLEVIDRVLVSQVTSRPLSADEIRDRGIVVDQTSFQVVSFSAAFGLQDRPVTIDFPMIVPTGTGASLPAAAPPITLPTLQPAQVPTAGAPLPLLQQAFQTANVGISGLLLRVEDEEVARQFQIPPLPGVIVIPGNVAYLNQFFSVLLLVSNVAPGHSNLVVRDITAEIVLPAGGDTVSGSGDDPLRMARLGTPPAEQDRVQPVRQAGPDGRLGTPDDIITVGPQQSGNSEHLVEGLREGTHAIEMRISGTLDGLPVGPVAVSGRVVGTVEVRNPSFALTLSHPATVSAGEEYDFLVTVTNTSSAVANFVSLSLSPRSISGAQLLSEQTVQIDTIAAGDSATARFRLRSQQTGTVTATSFTSDGVPGRFELTTAVGALGIPMSPNTLVLPDAADALPDALRSAGLALLGQAFALATAPVLPQGLLPIGQQVVHDRATQLAQAGQRVGLDESLASVARDLALQWTGHEFARLPDRYGPDQAAALEHARQNARGWDALFRRSPRGAAFLSVLGEIFTADLQAAGAGAFTAAWGSATVSGPPHLLIAATPGTAAVSLRLVDPAARQLGHQAPAQAVATEVPFGASVPLGTAAGGTGELLLVSTPETGEYRLAATASGSGVCDLALLVPDGPGLRRVVFPGVALQAGDVATLVIRVGAPGGEVLEIDENADGAPERQIPAATAELIVDQGPTLLSARQVVTGRDDPSQFGQLMALVFSEEIDRASSQHGLDPSDLTHYGVELNQVVGAALQPGGRVVLLALRDGIGPGTARSVTVRDVTDTSGNGLVPSPATLPITATITLPGTSVAGRVRRGDGSAVPNARLRLLQRPGITDRTVTVKSASADGSYSLDYVRDLPTTIEAVDPVSGERGDVRFQPGTVHRDVDIILLGTGTIAGRTLSPAGVPLSGAVVQISSLTRLGERFAAVSDAGGGFVINGIPVGNVTLEAAHVATNARALLAAAIPSAGSVVVQDITLVPIAQAALRTGTVTGQVFRPDGVTPASGIPVFTTRGGLATTDAGGTYRIESIPEGPVTIRAVDQAGLAEATVATTIPANGTVTANLRLFGGTGTISGTVLDPDGTPVANVVVGGGATLVRTNTQGRFELGVVPLGTRTITALDEARQLTGSASVTLAVPGEHAQVQVFLEPRGTIAGRVFLSDGTTPVAGLKVFLLGPRNLSALTDASGGYRFTSVPAGSYQVSAFHPDFSDGNIVATRINFLGEVRTTNVVFRGKGRVIGTVLADDGVTPLGARVGLSEVQVIIGQLRPPENPLCASNVQVGDRTVEFPPCESVGIGFRVASLTRVADTDVSTGTFAFDDVFVGTVTVDAANAFSPQVISARGSIDAPGQVAAFTLRLVGTGAVSGVVFTPDGSPVGEGVPVTLRAPGLGSDSQGYPTVITDPNGRYLHTTVPPGAFELRARRQDGLVAQARGSVEPGVTAEIPLRLLGRGTVRVQVTGAAGPVAGASIHLRGGAYPYDERSGETDADGRIVFQGADALAEGPFSVTASFAGITGFSSGTVPGADAQVDVLIQLPDEAGSVNGRFLRADLTTPIPNAQIRLSSAGGDAFATTAADGSYSFEGVRRGGITIEGFDPVTAGRGRSHGRVDAHGQVVALDVIQVAQGTVRGFVRRSTDGAAIAGADVTISVSSVFGGSFRTTSDLDGGFSFPGVSAGAFTVAARDPLTGLAGSATAALSSEGEVVSVDVDIIVPARGRVEGVVRTHAGTPVPTAQVALGGLTTTVDNAGRFVFPDVPMGPFALSVVAGRDAGRGSGTLTFDGETAIVDVTLIGTGTVTGIVRTAGGVPVSSAAVTLAGTSAVGGITATPTQTDDQGRFTFDQVLVGRISVTAVQAGSRLAGTASGEIAGPGNILDLVVTLQPSGSVSGRIVRQDGTTPAAGMALELVNGSRRFGSTSADGAFAFSDLALSHYQLLVTDPLGSGVVRAIFLLETEGQAVSLGTLVLDEAPPEVLSIVPGDGLTTAGVTQPIDVQFSEPVDPGSVTAATILVATTSGSVAGAWSLTSDRTHAVFTPAAPYGDFTRVNVKVTTAVRDAAGKPLAREWISSFQTADSQPPVTHGLAPAPAAVNIDPAAVVRVAYSEAINPAAFSAPAVQLTLNGAPVPGALTFILNNTAVVFTPAAPLAPNSVYQVSVAAASDVFGNRQPSGSSYSFSTIDTQPPTIARLVTPSQTVYAGSIVSVAAEIPGTTDVAQVEFFAGGAPARIDREAPFEAEVPVSAPEGGSLVVTARAWDTSGNIGPTVSLTLAVQADAAPTVAIQAPLDGGSVATGQSFTLRLRADDDRAVSRLAYQTAGPLVRSGTFTVSPPASPAEATFSVAVPTSTAPGPLTVRAAATDSSGAASQTRSILLTVTDATPPAVQMIAPAPGAPLNAGQSASVIASASDNGTLQAITIATSGAASSSQTVTIGTGSAAQVGFEVPIPIAPAQESLTITLSARDAAGLDSASVSRTFVVLVPDTTAPALSGVATASGSPRVLAGEAALLRAEVSDNTGVTSLTFATEGGHVSTGSVPVAPPVAAGTISFQVPVPASVPNGATVTVRVRALDAAGNQSPEQSIVLTVGDTAAPSLIIVSPAEGSQAVPGQTLNITARATDDTAVQRVVLSTSGTFSSSVTQTLEPPAASADVLFSITVPADTRAGALVLAVQAIDAAGNSSATVTRTLSVPDTLAPAATISAPASGTVIDPRVPLEVVVTASDETGVSRVDLSVTGAATFAGTRPVDPPSLNQTETFQVTFGALPIAGGSLSIAADARDTAGNTGSAGPATFLVADVVAPNVVAASPADGAVNVDPQALMTVEFSEPMDATSVSTTTVALAREGTPEPAGVTLSADGRVATIVPQARPLALNSTFAITIAAGVADRAGNQMGAPRTFTFRTAAPDTAGPRVLATSPVNNAVDVGLGTAVEITFSEAIAAGSLGPESFRIVLGGTPVAGARTLLDAGTRARFVPASPFPAEAVILVELTSAITDTAGNALVDANGQPLATPYTLTFMTGRFGITHPAEGASLIEHTTATVEARATASLGVSTVVFTVNGTALPPAGPPFTGRFDVPAAASTPTLTIVASARNSQGVEIAADTRTVAVVVGLSVRPTLTGVQVGSVRHLRFSISSPQPDDVTIDVRAGDAAILAVPATPIVLAAGATFVDVPVTGVAAGNTAVIGESARGSAAAIVSVSAVTSGQTHAATAETVGLSQVNPPSSGTVMVAPGATAPTRIELFAAPARVETPVSVTSTNPLVAAATAANVPSGQTAVDLTITGGVAGVATLIIRAGDQVRSLTVVVGIVPAASLPALLARPVGLALLSPPSVGYVLTTAGAARTISVSLLPEPASAATAVTATSSNPAVATASATAIGPGEQVTTVAIDPRADGTTLIVLRAGSVTRALTVIVGGAVAGIAPVLIANPAGVAVTAAPSLGQVFAPLASVHGIRVRVLDAPAAADTPVSVVSSDSNVATMQGPALVPAGQQTVELSLATGSGGRAFLVLEADGRRYSLEIIVGSAPSAGSSPALVAPPVGTSVIAAPSLGRVIAPANIASAPTLVVSLLSDPAPSPVTVTIRSADPAIASPSGGSPSVLVIPAGQQTIDLPLSIAGTQGSAVITFEFAGARRELLVVVGTPAADRLPALFAPVAGVEIRP